MTNRSLPGSSTPSISRSTINHCSFSGLTPADRIHRSDLDTVKIFGKTFPEDSGSTAISPSNTVILRSTLSHCILTNSNARRCSLSNCELIEVSSAQSTNANDSKFDNVDSIRRSFVKNSIVTDRSSLNRSDISGSSVTDHSYLRRSKLDNVRLSRTQLKRSVLRDCDVSNCIIIKTDFTGLVLCHGFWKNGKLVGRVGENEVVAMTRDGQVSCLTYLYSLSLLFLGKMY
jgi:uncharacterized protein YjbI with pentapeptide repeats